MFVVPVCEKRRGGKVDGQTEKKDRKSSVNHIQFMSESPDGLYL